MATSEGLPLGQIIILNGAPRSGKSSIVEVIQADFEGVWVNLGVDAYVRHITPPRYRPGIGLRPGGERPNLEPLVARLYAALYASIAAHSRMGLNVVAEFGHHDSYSQPLGILPDCARLLAGLPVLFVGVRCPLDVVMGRRQAEGPERQGTYVKVEAGMPVPAPVIAWQDHVHRPGIYDLEIDTSVKSPEACAEGIRQLLARDLPHPTAFEKIASGD
ncbi:MULTISPECIES: chloramphenicol phosphotransferase CPT family protein [Rhizobium]|uniref:Chloramphenicol 3-O phosphotransferase n=1 Tax=Rhizobium tropici TaxID=398 RepID=A0A6P1CFD4_RHITR|nr:MULTISPECIES: chloramphenicol phosphotransferase [Rhizobium]AGB70328.1 chloramphenicol phosphotransferase family protein [Rhizobium tropici CIAT 899]MBB4245257.1 chloramphenicol 3-O phosphotransferase [Rhizobium tropici]MBB5596657.1 chloramphenicol 3-O phosphotransferase [Rhizobium tropici]MBB6495633.1 chloramphenicol 3-O phosphotransferase [Rhizobium tropici]NEV14862.1 chloramphenicol phosphotransferase [Rhizobium tropici]